MINIGIAYMGRGNWCSFILGEELKAVIPGVDDYNLAQRATIAHAKQMVHDISRGQLGTAVDYTILPGVMLLPNLYPISRTPALLRDCAYQIGSNIMYVWAKNRLVSIDISSAWDPLCTASIVVTDSNGGIAYGVRASEWATDNQDRKLKITAQYWAAWIDEVLGP